jgi:hypothetical protein
MAAVLLAATGCAGLPVDERNALDEGRYFTLRTARDISQARLEGQALYGPNIDVALFPDGCRGRAVGGLIDLRASADRIVGTAGAGGTTDLHYEQLPDRLVMRGLYSGQLGTFEASNERLTGSIGGCTYQMERMRAPGALYYGHRSCGRSIGSAQLEVPADLDRRPTATRAVLLAVFLGGG